VRGEGVFERISWGEALQTVAKKLKEVIAEHGATSLLCQGSSGSPGRLHSPAPIYRLFNKLEMCLPVGERVR